ncbi:hypothetical protein PGT21_024672 [Puccinia graminis f. sp. tritici]|uniref:Aquaporin n=1 Tax=Puccinia graminis f. sp. tritici TaxID=56615 RepID=A0A5B0MS28_PUCGR|nr:hypothetical protein PGT21_024610 [Puccinia graminis f. sp. tritici]KAA1076939.1 hypothetical protein PGT21_024672 [Puccinia graminis f. sp. tritici]KAA1078914.1 hypothetical protein PGTUg99_020650 [Puccinia graminis f. sp. tritici]
MMDPVYSQSRSRSSSHASSSGQSVILNTPNDPTPEEKVRSREHEELLSDGSPFKAPRLPEIGYELPYNELPRSEIDRQRQIPPHHNLAHTYHAGVDPAASKPPSPSLVVKFKRATRVFWAEFFGTAVLALFGTAVNNQVALSNSPLVSNAPAGTYLSVSFGWALAVMLGVFVSGGVSGGHINPAITLSMAIFRRFPWYKVPVYWLAQISGAVFGAGLTYWNYSTAINLYEGGTGARTIEKTGGLFFTNPLPYTTNYLCFYNEVLMTAILMIFVVAVGDEGNTAPPKNLGPFVVFWVVFGLASTLGMQTSFALNPARDLGPRIVTWLAGYGGGVWSVRSSYWFSVAILGPVFGAILGCFVYDFFIATERVPDCAMHRTRDIRALVKKFRDITPLKDPEQTNLTKYERQRPSRDFPAGRRLPTTHVDETSSARTTSHRYNSLTRG